MVDGSLVVVFKHDWSIVGTMVKLGCNGFYFGGQVNFCNIFCLFVCSVCCLAIVVALKCIVSRVDSGWESCVSLKFIVSFIMLLTFITILDHYNVFLVHGHFWISYLW